MTAPSRVTLAIRAGASSPSAVSSAFIDAIDSVVVRQQADSPSTFQIVLNADLPKKLAADIPVIAAGEAAPGNRVKIGLNLGSGRACLIDGVSVHQELKYDAASGAFTYSIIGEDLSLYMRLEEKSTEWPERSCAQIVREIVDTYGSRGLTPTIVTPQSDFAPGKTQWLYRQSASDYDFIRMLGRPFGHLFAVRPGSTIDADAVAYWGPPARDGAKLPALSVSMGAWTNVDELEFAYDASAARGYDGTSRTEDDPPASLTVTSEWELGLTSFAKNAATESPLRRTVRYVDSGVVGALATASASSIVQESARSALRAKAKIDGLVYGTVVSPAAQIPVRGVGGSHDGLYYVEQVEHTIKRGSYTQAIVMTREGLGSTISEAT
jgi:phage protein D